MSGDFDPFRRDRGLDESRRHNRELERAARRANADPADLMAVETDAEILALPVRQRSVIVDRVIDYGIAGTIKRMRAGTWGTAEQEHPTIAILERLAGVPPTRPKRQPGDGPIASPEQAIESYERLGSDRKAAKELGVSRTQLRRLRGADK